jgi:hypothetical protein
MKKIRNNEKTNIFEDVFVAIYSSVLFNSITWIRIRIFKRNKDPDPHPATGPPAPDLISNIPAFNLHFYVGKILRQYTVGVLIVYPYLLLLIKKEALIFSR